jgi:phosphonate transport system permease protein
MKFNSNKREKMDKQKESTKIRIGIKILFWSIFLAFFIYSFQTIMDFEGITNPRRQESFFRILIAFSNPNFSDGKANRDLAVLTLDTIQTAFLATTIGAIFSMSLTFLSARPSSFWGRGFNILLQVILSAVRAVHPLLITFPLIILFGIGPTAGVLALTIFSIAILSRNFSEYAQKHSSLTWSTLFKVHFLGLSFKHLPVNILIATILGFVGGGGIGFLLQQNINLLNYDDASAAILVFIVVIGSIDLLSRAVWHKIENNTKKTN